MDTKNPGGFFSERTRIEKFPNALTGKLEALRSKGIRVIDLAESNPTRCGFKLPSGWLEALQAPEISVYEPSPKGLLKARSAVADYYGRKGVCVDPESVFLTSGTSEGYGFLFRLLLNPGDSVLVPRPSYPLLDFLAMFNDVKIEPYSLDRARGWLAASGAFDGVGPKLARALILIHPNNPTGHYISDGERVRVNLFCRERGVPLIVDEVFHDFSLSEGPVPSSFASNSEVLTFTLNGFSKILGLPQMKLGWLTVSGPADLKKEALARLELLGDTYLSVNTPVQHAASFWLERRTGMTGVIRARIRENYEFLARTAPGSGFSLCKAQGGWYAVLVLPEIFPDAEEFSLGLLEEHNVLVHPGYLFDFEKDRFVVLSLLPEPGLFKEGIRKMLEAYSS